ncbi:hypothetical protein [Flavobacterium sp.]|jgi:hypothetical protein|uniref:hypothetical protein n=1 Tax=Flavobacterium sp. TaxID=239 RepID=UPI0037C06454
MTRKNFEAIAKAIKFANQCEDKEQFVHVLTSELVRHFNEVNPNFDEYKFIKACEV